MNEKSIKIEVGIGEAYDRLSILQIKKLKVKENDERLYNIDKQINDLEKSLEGAGTLLQNDNISFLGLKFVNHAIWEIEDNLRILMKNKEKILSDPQSIEAKNFIIFSMRIPILNDQRSKLKNEISMKFNSKIIEVKIHRRDENE